MVEKGQLARKFLSTYHAERWPVAQNVLNIDKIAAKAAAGHQAADYCDVVEKNRLFTAGYGIHYDYNPDDYACSLMWAPPDEMKEAHDYVIQPGMRAPNFKVFGYASGKKTRLFDAGILHKDPNVPTWLTFTVFVLASDLRITHETVSRFLNETSKATTLLPPTNVVVVTTSTADQIASYKEVLDSDRVVIDKLNQAQCHRAYHKKIVHSTEEEEKSKKMVQLVLARPDGYIGTIIRGDNDGVMLSNKVCRYFSNIV